MTKSISLFGQDMPHNQDAEEGLLACLMIDDDGTVANMCMSRKITPEYFYSQKNRIVYMAIMEVASEGKPCDCVLLSDKLQKKNELEAIGGMAEVFRISQRVETSAPAGHFLKIIKDKYFLRNLITICAETIDKAQLEKDEDPRSHLEYIQERCMGLDVETTDINNSIERIASEVEAEIELPPDKRQSKAIKTGLDVLDNLIDGYYPQRMITIAGRPATGKTSILLSSILEMAMNYATPCLFFSFEMSEQEIAKRFVGMLTNLPLPRIMDNRLSTQERIAVQKAFAVIKSLPIFVVETSDMTVEGIALKVRHMKKRHNIQFVGIDYLQLISATQSKGTRESEIAHISRSIKKMAKSNNLPIVMLAQLNRSVEYENRKPRPSDLRDSGSIEQDSDQIILLNPMGVDDGIPKPKYDIEVIKGKDRHGACPLTQIAQFNKQATRYESSKSVYFKAGARELDFSHKSPNDYDDRQPF